MNEKEAKIRRGDIVVETHTYRTLGPSHYAGIVFSTKPLMIYPASGTNGVRMPEKEGNVDFEIVPQSLLTRAFNIVVGKVRFAVFQK